MNVSFSLESRAIAMNRSKPGRAAALACSLLLALFATGCSQHVQPKLYATPDAAVDSVVSALRTNDKAELTRILGSEADELLSSGDAVADTQGRQEFIEQFDRKHRLVPDEGGQSVTLEVGDADWPMPIPIVKDSDGWRFDPEAGVDELLNRRIGRNELATIETCRALNDAQTEYFALNPRKSPAPEYAQKFISSNGARDGLAWSTAEGEAPSPMGELVAEAADEGYVATGKGGPYHGYVFRLLTAQGEFAPGGTMSYLSGDRLTKGFAVVAHPAQYGNSGIMTFIMNQQGIVYQRDLGASSASIAKAMREFNPGPEWTLAD